VNIKKKIKVELDQTDAAIAAVLLAEQAGRQALKALLADKAAEIGGTTNRGARALADSYIKVGCALTLEIMAEKTNQGMQSTFSLARATARMADAIKASDVILEAMEEEL
jgi:hypothetical protein